MPHFKGAADGHVYHESWSEPGAEAAIIVLHGFGEHPARYHRLRQQDEAALESRVAPEMAPLTSA